MFDIEPSTISAVLASWRRSFAFSLCCSVPKLGAYRGRMGLNESLATNRK